MKSLSHTRKLEHFIAVQNDLLRSGQINQVAERVIALHKYSQTKVYKNFDFYLLAVVACAKANRSTHEQMFRRLLKECPGYTIKTEAEITRLISKPSRGLIDQFARAVQQWWHRNVTP